VAFYSPPGHDAAKRNEPLGQMQKPLPPEESRKHAITPEGFRVELFASEPLLQGKPLAFAFDGDGWVYGIVGYSGFGGKVGDENLRFGAGFYRFKPDGSRLEYLRSTNNNSWGFGFSEEGLVFGSTANGNPSEHMPLPNRVYERVRGWSATTLRGIAGSPKMELAPKATGEGTVAIRQVDHHGHFTAAAGHRLYTARVYPREYWNRTAFVCEPTGHIVATFELSPQGARFTSRMGWDLVASDDEWTAPVQAEIGPDGQVWVIDWYNFIVQHSPTPAGFETGKRGAYVTPLRDKTHGRLWRVVYDKAAITARTSLALARVQSALAHPSAGVRMNAVKALPRDPGTLTKLAGSNLAADPAPLVRLAVLEALGEWSPSPEAAAIVVAMLADPRTLADPVLADAAASAAAVQAAGVLPSLIPANAADSKPSPAKLVLIERVAEHVARGVDGNALAALLVRLPEAPPAFAAAALAGLARGWPKGTPAALGAEADAALVKLVATLPADVQGQVVTLARHAGSKALDSQVNRISEALIAAIDITNAEDAARIEAAERLVQLRPADEAVVKLLMERVGGRTSPEVSAGFIAALGKSTAADAPTTILDRLGSFTPQLREVAVRTVLANRD
jgi:hypothetical protein